MDIINKKTFQYVKLENCMEDELFMVETMDGSEVYFYSGNQKGANAYIDNGFKYKKNGDLTKNSKEKNTSFNHTVGGDVSYVLIDLDGKDVSKVKWQVRRFSPLVKSSETSNLQPHNGIVYAQNAPHSKPNEKSETMISYWERIVGKKATVNLDDFTCPCCGKHVKREEIDGAHVKIVGRSGQFITPACKDCNEYKVVTDRYFKVSENDIVPAP